MKNTFNKLTLIFGSVCLISFSNQAGAAVILQTWDFEGANGDMSGANAGYGQNWNIITAGTLYDQGTPATLAVPVSLPNQSGTYAVRTFQDNDGNGNINTAANTNNGIVVTDSFTMPANAELDYLIAGRQSAVNGASFTVEELVAGTWTTIQYCDLELRCTI